MTNFSFSFIQKISILLLFIKMSKSLYLKKFNNVAIVGGGMAGLAVGYNLAPLVDKLTIHDQSPVGSASASSACAGLMHPFAPRGNIIWKGMEGFKVSKTIMDSLETEVSGDLYEKDIKILRPIFTDTDMRNWKKTNKLIPEWVDLIDSPTYKNLTNEVSNDLLGAVIIKNALIVNSNKYLLELWDYIKVNCKNAEWNSECVEDVKSLSESHDLVILACGAGIFGLWDNTDNFLNINFVRGQNIIVKTTEDNLQSALLNGDYIIPRKISHVDSLREPNSTKANDNYLLCGATHEHIKPDENNPFEILNQKPNLATAFELLKPRLEKTYSPFLNKSHQFNPVSAVAGVRVATTRTQLGRLPIAGRFPRLDNVWVITGFGSRGLIHHSLVAEYLVKAVFENDENIIPFPLHPKCHFK